MTFALDPKTGCLQRFHHYDDVLNPSYLAWARGESRLYAAEADFESPGRILSLDFESDGSLSLSGSQPLSGSVACHVRRAAAPFRSLRLIVYELVRRSV